jgi:hypothetical protein
MVMAFLVNQKNKQLKKNKYFMKIYLTLLASISISLNGCSTAQQIWSPSSYEAKQQSSILYVMPSTQYITKNHTYKKPSKYYGARTTYENNPNIDYIDDSQSSIDYIDN